MNQDTNPTTLLSQIRQAMETVRVPELEKELKIIDEQIAEPELWSDQNRAQNLLKNQSDISQRIDAWRSLETGVSELVELLALEDPSLSKDIETQVNSLQSNFDKLSTELLFSDKYDDHDAIVSVYAGAGGTDAQDWAQMIMRMYLRWAEKSGFKSQIIDESTGEEAGIKSVTFEISGSFAFGRMQSESGVHRLVRLSPFNSDSLRQTSFAKVDVVPKIDSPDEIEIDDKDLRIDVYRSGGKGGQSVNTTDSAVRITHLPTNIVVAIQNERSQLQNKETAMTILRSKLAQLQTEQHLDDISKLKGPNEQASWGNQIRSYVLHPYKQVKDLRTRHESSDPDSVLDGQLDDFIQAFLQKKSTFSPLRKVVD